MGLKTMVLAGTALAAMTISAPAFAASAFAATQTGTVAVAEPDRMASQVSGDRDNDVAGLRDESPVCSALGAETIPTGDVVAKCLAGTRII